MKIKRLIPLAFGILVACALCWMRVKKIQLPPYERVYVVSVQSGVADGNQTYEVIVQDSGSRPAGKLSLSPQLASKIKKGDGLLKIVDYTDDSHIDNLYAYEARFFFIDLASAFLALLGLYWVFLLFKTVKN